ncbi:MAG TPA: hypothetical protein DHV57_16825 [Hyphomonas sp.]|nr:hypothetical protein [Hyphomonas sp.]|tara:strand:+ start:450 stop:902 length:453 start_codon:yes stop_codon:yes gene_type:complete
MKVVMSAIIVATGVAVSGCTSADLAAFSEGLAEASYDLQANSSAPYGSPGVPIYAPNYYGGVPSYAAGTWVGYGECRSTGSFYQCDTSGDGYADMYGDTADGSMASSSLRINGRGEAFTWGSDCACWERNRAYDGPRSDGDSHHHGHRDH